MSEANSSQAPGSAVCPLCNGVPEHPEIEGSLGCMACDFHGTLAGYEQMQKLEAEARATPMPERDYDGP